MICPKCKKEFLSGDKVCPYCGEEIVEQEVVSEKVEETAEEVVETANAEETSEVVETAEEAVETAEEAVEETDDTEEKIAEALLAEKKAKSAVNVLIALIVVAVIIIAAMAAMMFLDKKGDDAAETTALTTTDGVVTTDDAETTVDTAVTEPVEIVQGAIPFDGMFQDGHKVNHENGFPYKDTNIDEYIKLGSYKGQTVEVTLPETTSDEEFAKQLNYFLMQYAELGDAVTDRPAALNDTVLIDYAGTLDGVAFEGGTASDQTATLGMGQFIPGFEEGIVGMNIGETKDINVTFPENYGVETLNGKAVVFKITLKSITENVLPDYTDDFVMSNFGIPTVAEFENELRSMNAEEAMNERRSAIMEILSTGSEIIKYPEGTVEDYIYQQFSSDMLTSGQYGMSVEDYIKSYYGMDVPTYEAQVVEMAEGMVAQELSLYAVAKAEGLTVTDEDMASEIADILAYYGETDLATLCDTMGIGEELLENSLHFSAVYNKVTDFMMKNTTFVVVE